MQGGLIAPEPGRVYVEPSKYGVNDPHAVLGTVTMAFDRNLRAFVLAGCQARLQDKNSFTAFASVPCLANAKFLELREKFPVF